MVSPSSGSAFLPEGGHLDDLVSEAHVAQPEPSPDDEAVAEELLHLLGRGVGADIEVLRLAAKEQIAHAAADQERLEAGTAEPIENPQRIGIDLLSGQRVLRAGEDPRLH